MKQRGVLSRFNLTISMKLLVVLVVLATSSAAIIATYQYREARRSLEEAAFSRLTAAREFKAQQIEEYFENISRQVSAFSRSLTVIEAMTALREGVERLEPANVDGILPELSTYYGREFVSRLIGEGQIDPRSRISGTAFIPEDPQAQRLQHLYISSNPNAVGSKQLLDNAGDGSAYSSAHETFHPIIRDYLNRFGFYDIFLVDEQTGRIVYSVFKEVDFGTSLIDGPYADTGIARAFAAAQSATDPDFVTLLDFEPYLPSYNEPAGFVASPIFSGETRIGVLIFQMPIDRINDIMTNNEAWNMVGLGESGETYIVGDDLLMRNQSRFLIEDREAYLEMLRSTGLDESVIARIERFNTSIDLQPVDTDGTRAAISGEASTEIFPDYRGITVLSAYRPLNIPGLNWAILSEIDAAEAFAPVERLRTTILRMMAVFIIAVIALSILFARAMTRPIKVLTQKAQQLAQGDLGIPIDTQGGDEIAQLARSFDSMRDALRELIEGLEQKVQDRTKSLSDSETRVRSILDSAADSIVVINDKGIVQTFNPSAEETFGYSANEIIGGKVDTLMPERMARDHDAHMNRYYETGERRVVGKTREVVGQRKDGTEFPMELHVGEAFLGDERIFVGIIRDITERKAQEKKIADNLSFVTALVEAVPNPIFVTDTSGQYVNVNAAYEKAFDVRRSEIVGKTILELDFLSEEYRSARYQEDLHLLEHGGSAHREVSIVLGDGEEHQMLFWATVFRLSDGEIGGLLGVFVDISHQKELERQLSIANKRMGDELNIGRQIQMSMIPLTFPRFPEHKDLDVWAHIRPAREVGGDFYDFFMVDERYFAFVIADVSGKGVPAALMMAVAKTLMKSRTQDTLSTASIIEGTNNELSENNDDCMFLTAFFGIVDTKTGKLTYTNAGHNPPYVIKTDGTITSLRDIHGPMIGVMEGLSYEQSELQLGVDDKILLYTDGVTEAFNAENVAYEEPRLETFLERSKHLGTKYLVEALVQDVDKHADGEEQSDDITVFCLRYVAWDVRDERGTVELRLLNNLSEIDRCLAGLREICERFELPQEVQNNFSIVLDDLLNNVVSYAFEDGEEHIIEVVMSTDGHRFIVSVTDEGVEFDPFLRQEPDIEADIDGRMIGGLGIHLIRNLMDDYSYRRVGHKNVTTLMKRLEQ